MSKPLVIIVHGGAGTYTDILNNAEKTKMKHDAIKAAAKAGYCKLTTGGTAVDAVEAAVMYMEENPIFNAGRGSYLTVSGDIEMDASIMDGSTMRAGGVTYMQNVLHPIHLSRLIMEKSNHALLAGEGAKQFAISQGVPIIPNDDLITERARERLQAFQTFNPTVLADERNKESKDDSHDTVGAVALDSEGNVAYANSTGGINAKLPGRVGDSPIIGSGGYCDNDIGAVTTTGHGESFMKMCFSKHAIMLMEQGDLPQDALENCLNIMKRKFGGTGGAVAVTPTGEMAVNFNTGGMAWCSIKDDQMTYGIAQSDKFTETYDHNL